MSVHEMLKMSERPEHGDIRRAKNHKTSLSRGFTRELLTEAAKKASLRLVPAEGQATQIVGTQHSCGWGHDPEIVHK